MKVLYFLLLVFVACNESKVITYNPIPSPSNFQITSCTLNECYTFRWEYEATDYNVYFRIQYYFWANDSWSNLQTDSSLTSVTVDSLSRNWVYLQDGQLFRVYATDGLRESYSDTVTFHFN